MSPITPDQWQEVSPYLDEVLELHPEERAAWLRSFSEKDARLASVVCALLDEERQLEQEGFLESSPLHAGARLAGQKLGPYTLISQIGQGGMGSVWLAQQTAPLQRKVALKLIRWGMYDDTLLRRFEAERQSLAVMDHPSIARVFDAGATLEGQPYFVMEYVAGVPITDYCDQKKLKISERLKLFIKVCEGVQHAHQKAIIHRDLKPANILVIDVDGTPVPRIIDFGVAKAINRDITEETVDTGMGNFVGTPGYMSPEQCDPATQDIDTRTDVYSMGVVLYTLLTGSLPFDTSEWKDQPFDEILRRLREEDPVRPSTKVSIDRDTSTAAAEARGTQPKQLVSMLRGDLDWITMKAVEIDRIRRYATPSDLAADIGRHLNNEPVTARPASLSYRMQKYVRRHRYSVAGAGVVIALLMAFALMQNIQLRKTRRERDRADHIAEFMVKMFKVSNPSEARGNSVTAREILDEASKGMESGLSKDPEVQSQMMNVMGDVYYNLGLFSQSQSLLEQALAVQRRVFGSDHPETLRTESLLGRTLQKEGHSEQAEKLERETLAVQRRVLGPENRDTLSTMSRLANVLMWMGQASEAESLDRELLETRRRILGPDDPETVGSMDDLAFCLSLEGEQGREADLSESEKLSREALAIKQRILGPEHPDTIASMANLGATLTLEHKLVESEMLTREALEMSDRILGPDHDVTLNSATYLVNTLQLEGRYAEAEKLEAETRAIQQRVLGPDYPATAVSTFNLACLEALQGHRERALSLLREAITHGLRPLQALAIEGDELKSLRGDPRYEALVAEVKTRAALVQQKQ
jgi:non-specific serine/threonine protein kinase/serine/threonine-protein kinase